MCGEHRSIVGIGVACQGSSPHVRGARRPRQPGIRPNGIIPACAGSTQVRLRRRPWTEDHPRMCGEHDAVPELSACDSGSSPHVRGALSCRNCLRLDCGIIPACAGSTSAVRPSIMVATDHPRMCGEHLEPSPVQNSTAGSSPHVRGARSTCWALTRSAGIIPACAGSTSRGRRCPWLSRDHPRMCGEHPVQRRSEHHQRGSSPHVRGARSAVSRSCWQAGIIPACAGSTQHSRSVLSPSRDHPRMCGEHTSKIA